MSRPLLATPRRLDDANEPEEEEEEPAPADSPIQRVGGGDPNGDAESAVSFDQPLVTATADAYGSPGAGIKTMPNLLKEHDQRAAAFLLTRVADDYDEHVFAHCKEYVRRHKQFHEVLTSIRAKAPKSTAAGTAQDDGSGGPDDDGESRSFKTRLRNVFDKPFDSTAGKVVYTVTALMILVSIITLLVQSVPRFNPDVNEDYRPRWRGIEGVISIYFSAEIGIRFLLAKKKWRFIRSPMNICDVLAVLPFFIELASEEDVGVLRVLRLLRLVKFFRSSAAVDDLFSAVGSSLKILLAPILFLTACLIFMSSVLYYAERGTYDRGAQMFTIEDCNCESSVAYRFGGRQCPRKESAFYSIPHTMWWAVVTMTTVGYGDMVPECGFGKAVASVSMVLGVVFMAMPIAIVGSYFTITVDNRAKATSQQRIHEAEKHQKLLAQQTRIRQQQIEREQERAGLEGWGDMPDRHTDTAISGAARLLKFLDDRLESKSINVTDPHPYSMVLIDTFLASYNTFTSYAAAEQSGGGSRNSAWELVYITPTPTNTNPPPRVLSLHQPVKLVVGCSSPYTTDPDVVIPLEQLQRHTGVSYRVSQRHATITVPPPFTGLPVTITANKGATVYLNNTPVQAKVGSALRNGDVINFHTLDQPLLYRVREVSSFSLAL